jgi:hypothetical protein
MGAGLVGGNGLRMGWAVEGAVAASASASAARGEGEKGQEEARGGEEREIADHGRRQELAKVAGDISLDIARRNYFSISVRGRGWGRLRRGRLPLRKINCLIYIKNK